MALDENGTQFTERIEIDEEQDVEVFRVPAHNNFEGADFYHDFKKVRFEGFIQSSILHCPVKIIQNFATVNTLSRTIELLPP